MHYDRKSDTELPEGEIEEAVRKHEISVDQILATFRYWVTQALPDDGTVEKRADAQVKTIMEMMDARLKANTFPTTPKDAEVFRAELVAAILAIKPQKAG